eukprot:2731005-Prymnesium_polylepis.1
MASAFALTTSRPSAAAPPALPGPLASGETSSLRSSPSQSSPSKKGWPRTSHAPASPQPRRCAASIISILHSRLRACGPTKSCAHTKRGRATSSRRVRQRTRARGDSSTLGRPAQWGSAQRGAALPPAAGCAGLAARIHTPPERFRARALLER